MEKTKVFVVGPHKTATSSLAYALYILGYRVAGEPVPGLPSKEVKGMRPDLARQKVWNHMLTVLPEYEAFQDTPWFVFFREMDEAYPGSKFILTTRPSDRWIKSVVTHFGTQRFPHHTWIYGVPYAKGHEDVYVKTFEKHMSDVKEYFKDRPDDLLILDIGTELTWDLLCPFIGETEPPFGFPRQNRAGDRSGGLARVIRVIRRLFKKATRQKTDHKVIREFWDDSFLDVRRFGKSVIDLLAENPDLPADKYKALESTLMDAYEQTNRLKRFLDIVIVEREWPAIDSAEAFHTVWPMMALDFRQLFGDIGEFDVSRVWPENGKTVVQSANDILACLDDGYKRLSA